MATPPTTGTYPLAELDDFTVAQGAPDPRGWPVATSDAQLVGTVDDLLVDLDAMVVRYLAVRVGGGAGGRVGAPERVLLPVGVARTEGDRRRVLVDVTAAQVVALPAFAPGGAVTRAYEDALLQGLRGAAGSARASGPQYYEGPEFETGRFYGLAAAAAGAPGAAIDGDTVRVVAMGEEPVITTRLVVKELLVIKRRRVVEDRVIEVDLRSERVDVDQRGAAAPQPDADTR